MDNLINYQNAVLIYKLDSVFYKSVHIYILNSVVIINVRMFKDIIIRVQMEII